MIAETCPIQRVNGKLVKGCGQSFQPHETGAIILDDILIGYSCIKCHKTWRPNLTPTYDLVADVQQMTAEFNLNRAEGTITSL